LNFISIRKLTPFVLAASSSLCFYSLNAATFTVSVLTDMGFAGELRTAINEANTAGGTNTINFSIMTGTISLTGALPPINNNLTINGPSLSSGMPAIIINGSASGSPVTLSTQAFYIASGLTVSINNLQMENCAALGGNHTSGVQLGGGGGGGGAGGGIMVHDGCTVATSNLVFTSNSAVGGRGMDGTETTGNSAGGGGGFCGAPGGASNTGTDVGGGGGGDPLGTAGTTSGSGGNGGAGGTGGCQGGSCTHLGGGGGGGDNIDGFNSNNTCPATVSNQACGGPGGGTGGGGGGQAVASGSGVIAGSGGLGGFGGGGGGGGPADLASSNTGGAGGGGGFGGGGGGNGPASPLVSVGTSLFGGGAGGQGNTSSDLGGGGGGGGAGMGGAIFVRESGTLMITNGSISGNTATGGAPGTGTTGAGGSAPQPGGAYGQDIFLMSGGTLIFDVSSTFTVATPIQSDLNAGLGGTGGGLTMSGSGTLSLNGTNTYTGTTMVNAGTLNVNGSLIGPVVVNSGAILNGVFSILATGSFDGSLTNSGTVSPGNSIGTINVATNYIQNSSGILNIEISPSGSSVLAVGGLASLAGTVQFTADPGTYTAGTYVFLTAADSVIGTFTTVNFASLSGFTQSLVYGSNFVSLILAGGAPPPPPTPSAFSGKGGSPAAYLSCIKYLAAPGSSLSTIISELLDLSGQAQQNALNSITPTVLGSLALAQESNTIAMRTATTHRTTLLHSVNLPFDKSEKFGFCIWQDGFYDHIRQKHNQTGFHGNNNGGILGIDFQAFKNLYIGAIGSYTHSHLQWKNSAGHGSIRSYYGGLYGTWYRDIGYVDLSMFGAQNNYHETRNISFAATDTTAKSRHKGLEFASNARGGLTFRIPAQPDPNIWEKKREKERISYGEMYKQKFVGYGGTKETQKPYGGMVLEPFLSFDYIYLHENSFNENGAGILDLHVSKKNANYLRTEIGFRFTYCGVTERAKFIPEAKLSYVRESRFEGKRYYSYFNEIGVVPCGSSTGSQQMISNTRPPDRNLFNPEFGLNILLLENTFDISVYYEAEVGSHYLEQQGRLHLEFRF
jgi:uncharacterized protein with beta-barrel porin domain